MFLLMFCFCPKTDLVNKVKIQELTDENKKLKDENCKLKNTMQKTQTSWANDIDDFVDEWYEKNKDDIDIGVINLKFFKIDLFPDNIEKHIYKKVLKILFSFLKTALSPKENIHEKLL